MIRYRVIARGLLLGGFVLANGCAVQPSRPTQLLVLAPLATAPTATVARAARPALVIGPINLPAYSERPQVLTLHDESELLVAEAARWAEPLDKNFSRVLVENLSRLLGTDSIATLGALQSPASLQITVEVTEFVVTDAGQARLTAYWRVLGNGGRQILASHKTHYQEEAVGRDYPALVGAMSRALAALSRDLALAVEPFADAP